MKEKRQEKLQQKQEYAAKRHMEQLACIRYVHIFFHFVSKGTKILEISCLLNHSSEIRNLCLMK